ncbi:MAG: Glutathione transport system permease protein GsiD [Paracidovorax wautersii]|uniref:Glutathione transport system permease protein GsiD n=1 Tax=Paracidovorax wautersii TaxID=1177982 RepID=A0A7V8JR53_9BURK|nr:MAG: Glutathione transport system permease protein GsiD [Paracidovorax wautersii]
MSTTLPFPRTPALVAGFLARWRWPTPGDVVALLSLAVLLLFLVAAVQPAWLAPGDPLAADRTALLSAPSTVHVFGTDALGRDVYTRVVHGARPSLALGFGAVALALTVGTLLGLLAGLTRRVVPTVILRLTDIGAAFPELLMAIFIVALFGSGMGHATVAIGIAGIPYYTRVVRAQALQVRATAYVEAARSLGLTRAEVLLRHLVPNALRPVMAIATLGLGSATLAGAALSFLGLGNPPPAPEWGSMLTQARSFLTLGWWAAVFPGAALTLFVMSTTVLGQWLRRRLEGRR